MISLLRVEIARTWLMFRRYPLTYVGYSLITFVIFYGLFLGGSFLTGQGVMRQSRLDALVIGYVAWTLSMTAVVDISLALQEEMASGTLEHVCLSPFGLTRIYLARGLSKLLVNLITVAVVVLLIMLVTGHWVYPRPLAIPAMALMLCAAYGFSMFFGGMTLMFKRLGGMLALVQMLLLFITLTPVEERSLQVRILSALVPVMPEVTLMRQVLADPPQLDVLQIALATSNAVFYMVVGLLIFRRADRTMRNQGSVQHF